MTSAPAAPDGRSGTILIIGVTWFQVQLSVRINEWFGSFYDTLQQALGKPGAVTFEQILGYLWTFAGIAVVVLAPPQVRAAVRAASFEVLVGFQLDDASLAYNVGK